MMSGTPRIWLGGIVAYGISQILNVTIFSALKSGGGKLLWLRAAVASMLSQIADTLIFVTVAFYGVFPIQELLVGQMLAKVVLSLVLECARAARRWCERRIGSRCCKRP